ncbi:MAG TPA: class I SAM-dependent methyltransferase [Bryobacteraceae bacterium]|nr:class I SAM-dependent methyltransferase [Bryobacteraceae bacterium]
MRAANGLASSGAVKACPSCLTPDMRLFYRVEGAPVHSVLLMNGWKAAVDFPRGDIALGFCRACGFISNTAFDPSSHNYSGEYEETQSFSGTFRDFHEKLASRLIDRYGIRNKTVIEVGCGKGEFLALLCRMGGNRGIGIDPAFVPARNPAADCDAEFITEFYSEKFADRKADAIVCKMTLEHIQDTFAFVSLIRRSIGDKRDTMVFFQVPDAERILSEKAFWDIYYEHCSYFTAGSLSGLFIRAGFEPVEVTSEYGGQYLTIAARPADDQESASESALPADVEELERSVDQFSICSAHSIDTWRQRIARLATKGKRIAIWGSGSKGVAFLTAVRANSDIDCVVDINPYRQGKYMAGTGHRIISPAQLAKGKPDVVIAMNSIYRDEIRRSLDEHGVAAELLSL